MPSFTEITQRILSGSEKKPEPHFALDLGADKFLSGTNQTTQAVLPKGFGKEVAKREVVGAGLIAKAFGQGLARSYLATGQAITTRSLSEPFVHEPNSAFGRFTEALVGTKEPISLKKEDVELPFGIGEKTGGLITLGLTATDLLGGGGLKGIKGLAKALKEIEDVAEVGKLMKSAGFVDDVISEAAPLIAKSKDEKFILHALTESEKYQNELKATAKSARNGTVPEQFVPAEKSAVAPTSKGIRELERQGTPPTREKVLSAYNEQYTAGGGKSRDLNNSLESAEITTNEPGLFRRVSDRLQTVKTKTVEYVQNAETRVQALMKQGRITPESDVYTKMTLMPGRLDYLVTKARDTVKNTFNDMAKFAKTQGTDFNTVRKEVNDYLRFRHAPERNVELGEKAAGITTAEAEAGLHALEASPRASKIREYADTLSQMNRETLDMLRDSEVITEDLYNTLRTKYKNHVPLNRVFEDTDNIGEVLSGRGLDVRSTGIKSAKGSEREVGDIVENILVNYEQAAIRAEKNVVDLATLKFVRDNPSDIFEVTKPKAIGRAFKKAGEEEGRILLQTTSDPSILQLYEGGKRTWIKIKDPNLAIALRGVGREKLGTFMNAVGAFTRFYAGLATRFNPEFALSNKIRDLQETMIYLSAQKGVGAKGALKALKEDPSSWKAVVDSLRGADTEGARLYDEMKRLGGTTGGLGLSTRKAVSLNIERLEKLAQSNPRKFTENALQYIDDWNTIFEDSTRLSAYKAALEKGFSKDQAAFFAKEASINFNRMGKGGPVINALWMFSNASVQGSAKLIRAMKNPKVAMAVTATIGGAVATVNQWNDRVDPEWRDHVSKWDRMNSLPVALPSSEGTVRYLNIPVSWGVKPIKVISDYVYDATSGRAIDTKTAVEDFFVSVVDAYNPIGGTDATSAVTPTILDLPVELARNLKWSGAKIKPDLDPYAPESVKYFDSLAEKATGRASISLTEKLAGYGIEVSPADIQYAYEQTVGGAGRAATKFANTMYGFASGDLPPVSEFPFLSRFYKEKMADEIFDAEANQAVRGLMTEDRRERFYLTKRAEDEWAKIETMDPAERKQRLIDLARENEDLAEKVLDVAESQALNLQGADKQLKNAPLDVRTKYIANELKKLNTPEERKQLLNEYAKKKILTKKGLDMLINLLSGE